MEIEDCLNEKTRKIFHRPIKIGFDIQLEVNPTLENGQWGMMPSYTILAPNETPNKSAFTHELLHIYLFSIGFNETETIYRNANEDNLFNYEFIESTNNDLAHLKMVDVFLDSGFQ